MWCIYRNTLFCVFCDQTALSPAQARPFQSSLYVHVIAAVVCDDDIEVGILSDSEQLFHVRDELQHPPCLVFHWMYCKRERNKGKLISKMAWTDFKDGMAFSKQGFLPPLKPYQH